MRGLTFSEYDYLFKVTLVGNSGVGKSCLLLRFADNTYTESYVSTIGVDFKISSIKINDKTIKLQVWDVCGDSDRDRMQFVSGDTRGSHIYIIAYDVTDEQSFDDIPKWLKILDRQCAESAIKILVGTKSDLVAKKIIDRDVAQDFADSHGLTFLETSAKKDVNVQELFKLAAFECLLKISGPKIYEKLPEEKTKVAKPKPKSGVFSSIMRMFSRSSQPKRPKKVKEHKSINKYQPIAQPKVARQDDIKNAVALEIQSELNSIASGFNKNYSANDFLASRKNKADTFANFVWNQVKEIPGCSVSERVRLFNQYLAQGVDAYKKGQKIIKKQRECKAHEPAVSDLYRRPPAVNPDVSQAYHSQPFALFPANPSAPDDEQASSSACAEDLPPAYAPQSADAGTFFKANAPFTLAAAPDEPPPSYDQAAGALGLNV